MRVVAGVIAAVAAVSTGGLSALLSLASLGTLLDAFDLIQDIIGALKTSNKFKAVSMTRLPDFATLMDLGKVTTRYELLASLEKHAQAIQQNYAGPERAGLASLLKLSYAQAYQRLQ